MWGTTTRVIVASAVLVAAGTMTAPAAEAAVSDGYTSWHLQVQPDNPLASAGAYTLEPPEYSTWTDSTTPAGQVVMRVERTGNEWEAVFGGNADSPLVEGATYGGTREAPFGDVNGPFLHVTHG